MAEDFYKSLHRHGRDQSHLQSLLDSKYRDLLTTFQQLYDLSLSSPLTPHRIPKKIHQIWLGKEMPNRFSSYIQTWSALAGWEYRLWTDADVDSLLKYNRDLYLLANNYGEKSDILRLEILYQEGGLYVDVDSECLNSAFFDQLHQRLTFYAGFEPLAHRWLGISNSLLGSAPRHPLLLKMLLDLKSHFFTNHDRWAVIKTGPKFITQVIEQFLPHTPPDLCIFPPTYFSPASGHDIKQKDYPIFPESSAFHHWSGSWLLNAIE